ncbi:hypothetical protein A2130_01335 [Candidatus Woesebacteria bacterium GWC2_33_12]|uniref:Uncharacterized protein n=1 Tax=Candidatus Woesebacteria bacterium GW2011_GWB1_33_22 TaxID=1618566 RepID=A0A0F9ZZ46_9BACT|nr:MAG: hypothetical protein UR29_C0012G0012 [Candidatus Woesebacteria bacterium GW2011_GWC2_33_12]KKP41767.1 MAG: hypothetical protein UR33_C0010G0012 [Candidatus Woesebacteria bacterium GW2011_GWA2_33_20]KKP44221.1 MAG: hypothetical protein UR35_C0010G0013 [Candidatus Woesebacteria bacterium GW2011_GWB1_33_22]KKP45927.1 MAG: hypothetical protein UR37_C0013G0013 [Microgenomates group bacterium GW2011_GWC1_33_28]KKP49812.1 MAG: hypothetical protein UR41_C0012G0013 [Candidatus Woesebacteria bact
MAKSKVTVIIPYGHNTKQPERADVLKFVTEKCLHKQTYKDIKLVLIERSDSPYLKKYAKSAFDNYIFIKKNYGPFSVGKLQNIAIAKIKPDPFFYIHLPDFLLPLDTIEKTFNVQEKTGAPCVFPFYGAVSLTKPITEGIMEESIDWKKLMNKISKTTSSIEFKEKKNLIDHPKNPNRVKLTSQQIKWINSILPNQYKSKNLINKFTDKELWGNDIDNQFNFYGSFKSPGEDEALGNFRSGPRAKPSYLCLTETFIQVGGTTVKNKGWNCEDLWFWEKLRTYDTNYSIDNYGIYYKGKMLSGKYPVTHLWHDISSKLNYYKSAEDSIKQFNEFAKLSNEEKIRIIKPLDLERLAECQQI